MLKISRNQTKETMKLDGNDIKEVETFTYLGSCINKNGKIQNEINERKRKASNFHHLVKGLIRNRDTNNKCKIDIYKVYFILLYGAESWTCTKREESKIQAMEMKFLREILGKTRRDKIKNDDIREQLKIDDIKYNIERNRLKWYGHVMRMADERIPKRTLEMKLRGRRPRCRPRTRWMDQVMRDVEKRGKKWTQVKRDGMGRQGQMEISL
jgi:hypothetical protein